MRESLAPAPSLRSGPSGAVRRSAMRLAKRLLDLAVAAAALILLSPLLVAAAVLIRLTTPGPALFRQTRVGRDQQPFVLYKFRTMYGGCSDSPHREYVHALLTDDCPAAGGENGLYKLEHDTRITALGRILRLLQVGHLLVHLRHELLHVCDLRIDRARGRGGLLRRSRGLLCE